MRQIHYFFPTCIFSLNLHQLSYWFLSFTFLHANTTIAIIIFNMMLGLSTPPFGMCLFITSGISGTPLKDVIKEIWGPIVVMLAVLLIITFVPQSVLFLPKMFGMIA